jgi:hypothetical protein
MRFEEQNHTPGYKMGISTKLILIHMSHKYNTHDRLNVLTLY